MAHKIDESKGKSAFISFQQPAWHGLGKVFNTDLTVENALHDAGLDYHVQKSPNIHRIGDVDTVSTSSFFTYRTDTKDVLGSRLGPDYTVYQNVDALAVVDEMLKDGKVKIETAGAVDEGKRVFVCLKLQQPIVIGGNDAVDQYVLLANSHDGSLAITAMPTNVRVVCWNTLSAALSGAKANHKIRHTTNAKSRVEEAFRIMGLLEDSSKLNSAAYNAMKHNALTKQEFFDYIGNIFIDAEDIAKLQQGERGALSSRTKNVIEEVLEYSASGPGQPLALGNDLNMWYSYNAVTGYLTKKGYKTPDDRFNSLIFGDSANKIKAAGELALKPHNIRPLKKTASAGMGLN